MSYQPKTGQKCGCRRGIERDNCPNCEGTGWVIDFKAIRERTQKPQIVTKQTEVEFRGRKLAIPAGLKAAPVAPYPTQTRPQFWLEEWPADLFPPNSIERHDAIHYGVWLEQSDVETV